MKFLSALATICLYGSAIASPTAELMLRNVATVVPSHLAAPATFFRYISYREYNNAPRRYTVGHHPTGHSQSGGDFSPEGTGGLYVYERESDAVEGGASNAKAAPGGPCDTFYVVTLRYTPNPALRVRTFTSDGPDWQNFVRANYAGGPKHMYDIVEGPLSVDSRGNKIAALRSDGTPVWQGTFIEHAIDALEVQNVQEHKVKIGGSYKCTLL